MSLISFTNTVYHFHQPWLRHLSLAAHSCAHMHVYSPFTLLRPDFLLMVFSSTSRSYMRVIAVALREWFTHLSFPGIAYTCWLICCLTNADCLYKFRVFIINVFRVHRNVRRILNYQSREETMLLIYSVQQKVQPSVKKNFLCWVFGSLQPFSRNKASCSLKITSVLFPIAPMSFRYNTLVTMTKFLNQNWKWPFAFKNHKEGSILCQGYSAHHLLF